MQQQINHVQRLVALVLVVHAVHVAAAAVVGVVVVVVIGVANLEPSAIVGVGDVGGKLPRCVKCLLDNGNENVQHAINKQGNERVEVQTRQKQVLCCDGAECIVNRVTI